MPPGEDAAGPPPPPTPRPPPWASAVEEAPGGVRLLLEVQPGARAAAFPDGFNPWRGRIGLRVRAPAEDGRANEEMVRALAAFFAHPTARIHIEAGHLRPRKDVRVMGLTRAAALTRLAPHLEAPR